MNTLYLKAKERFLSGGIDLLTDTIKVSLLDADDVAFDAAHEFYSDISAAEIAVATLQTKTVTDGVFNAADTTFSDVSGDVFEAMALWKDTGDPATSPLIAYIQLTPLTPNGNDITVSWAASGIFAL